MIDAAAPEALAAVAAAFLLAAFVKGATGLGFSTCALPLLALSIGIREALPLVLAPSIASNLLVMRGAGHFRETVRRFWPLCLAVLPGIALGVALLVWVDPLIAGAALGLVLVGYAAFALARPPLTLPPRLERPLQWPVGLINGTVNGLTGSQVMPLLPYLLALQLDPNRFVQAINCVFTFSSLAMAVGLSEAGLLTGPAASGSTHTSSATPSATPGNAARQSGQKRRTVSRKCPAPRMTSRLLAIDGASTSGSASRIPMESASSGSAQVEKPSPVAPLTKAASRKAAATAASVSGPAASIMPVALPRKRDRLPGAVEDCHALAGADTSDGNGRALRCGEYQLVVVAAGQRVQPGLRPERRDFRRQRHCLQVDDGGNAGGMADMAEVGDEPVGNVGRSRCALGRAETGRG
ncbi:MAG: sulfite exporter TauE/SafE family protein [Rhodospirillales bacterium]|nr:sulfite exporter TauE/SafE family protein [Rhodospirillales bacterium]